MNKEDSKIFTIQELLEYIEDCEYIDCTEGSGHYDCNQYKSILYYLKQYKNNQERINKAIEYIEELNKVIPRYWFTKLLEILKGE